MDNEIRRRLARADALPVPDMWTDARARARGGVRPLPAPAGPSSRSRIVSGVVAFAVFLVAAALGWSALRPRSETIAVPGGPPHELVEILEPSGGMLPTIEIGQTVVVDVDAYGPAQGDIVAFEPARGDIVAFTIPDWPEGMLIKRVIGLPGDTVEETDGVVLVNGVPLDEPYITPDHRTLGPWTVEPGHLFVIGDNRPDSNDSRFPDGDIGQVPIGDVTGKVLLDVPATGHASAPPAATAATASPSA